MGSSKAALLFLPPSAVVPLADPVVNLQQEGGAKSGGEWCYNEEKGMNPQKLCEKSLINLELTLRHLTANFYAASWLHMDHKVSKNTCVRMLFVSINSLW